MSRVARQGQRKYKRRNPDDRAYVRFIKFILRWIFNNKLKSLIILTFIVLLILIGNFMSLYSGNRVTDKGYEHSKQFDEYAVINGIDVSEHQEDDINWKKVKSAGVDFVFVRVGYRSLTNGTLHADKNYRENLLNAKSKGLMVGAYFFSQATTSKEAKEEAEFMIKLVKGYDIDLPLVIDYESHEGGRLDKVIQSGSMYAASMFHDIVLSFCNTVEKSGYESAVYANYDMLVNNMDASILSEQATLWLAQYNTSAALESRYNYWQCSDSQKVSGIDNPVDHNFWYLKPEKVYPSYGQNRYNNRISIGDCDVSFNKEKYSIKNHRATPKVTVRYKGKLLKEGRNYNISFVNNSYNGTGYAIITGINKYSDRIALPFTIK